MTMTPAPAAEDLNSPKISEPNGRPDAKCRCDVADAEADAPDLGQPGGPEPGTETLPVGPGRRHAKVRTPAPLPPGASTAPGAEAMPDADTDMGAGGTEAPKRTAAKRTTVTQPPPPADADGKPDKPVAKGLSRPLAGPQPFPRAEPPDHRDYNTGKKEPDFTSKGLVGHLSDWADHKDGKPGEHRDPNTDGKEPKVPSGEIRGPWMVEAKKDLARLRAAGGSLPASLSHLPAKWLPNGGPQPEHHQRPGKRTGAPEPWRGRGHRRHHRRQGRQGQHAGRDGRDRLRGLRRRREVPRTVGRQPAHPRQWQVHHGHGRGRS
jgi:hypothetical protein